MTHFARTLAAAASLAVTVAVFCGIGFGMTAMSDENVQVAARAAATRQA